MVQYAGAGLGIGWLFVQYLFQIGIFYLIFGVVLSSGQNESLGVEAHRITGPDFLNYLLGAMTLWLPLSEMLLRSGSILSENRGLIRRTPGAMDAMTWIPLSQAILHFTILSVPTWIIAYASGGLAWTFPLGFFIGLFFLVAMAPFCIYLQRVSVLLKDLSPILRLGTQILFWATPMVYVVHNEKILSLMSWNPLFCMVDLERHLLYGMPPMADASLFGLLWFLPASLLLGLLSRFRLKEVSADFL